MLVLSCNQLGPQTLKEFKQQGELVVLTKNSPTTYYEDRDGSLAGMEYELAKSFGAYLGVKVTFKAIDDIQTLLQVLANGEADMAAAGITKTKNRTKRFLFGPEYQKISQQLVCHRKVKINSIDDLSQVKITVIKGSSHEDKLKEIAKTQKSKIPFKVVHDIFSEELLKDVEDKKVDCTISNSHIVNLHQRFFPNIRNRLQIGPEEKLAWALPKSKKFLQGEMEKWFKKIQKSGELRALIDKYYTYADDYDPYDVQIFKQRMKTRLPKYKNLFMAAAAKYDIPWKLLAAVSYQESHWNPWAKSPTGVRGLMMLTKYTAKRVGVKNRMNPKESIFGGALYLQKVLKRIPHHIRSPDRLWMALASYNIGYLHLRDARMLTVWKEKNSQIWHDVKKFLPNLGKKQYFKRLPHGYARGWEPVAYVQRIRNYYDLLEEANI